MTRYQFRIKRGARTDAREASEWYEREAPEIVGAFRKELSVVLDTIAENPRMYPEVRGTVRRALMTRFPYSILFSIDNHVVVVIAISHQSRSENHWNRRL